MDANKFLPKSCVPHVESKTERALTGGWGRGPGNNVSAVMCGVNAAQHTMAAHMDDNFAHVFKARREARKASKHLAGKRKWSSNPVQGPAPAPKLREAMPHIPVGSATAALSSWQQRGLDRIHGKR